MSDARIDLTMQLREPNELQPRFGTALVPRNSISGRALVAVVAIMTFLVSLTTGAAVLVTKAAGEWQSDISREITIQIICLRRMSIVSRTVQLDHELCVRAVEIQRSVAEWLLAAKFESCRFAISELRPEFSLRHRRAFSKTSRVCHSHSRALTLILSPWERNRFQRGLVPPHAKALSKVLVVASRVVEEAE